MNNTYCYSCEVTLDICECGVGDEFFTSVNRCEDCLCVKREDHHLTCVEILNA